MNSLNIDTLFRSKHLKCHFAPHCDLKMFRCLYFIKNTEEESNVCSMEVHYISDD